MNLLMTLDRNYVPQLNVMLFSALHSDSAAHFDVYLLHDEGQSEEDVAGTRVLLGQRGELHLIRVNEDGLADAPTSDRYPKAIYYRIFAAKYLPDTLERVLYLDPDIVVRQSLRELYEMAYSLPSIAAYLYKSTTKRLQVIFGPYLPEAQPKDFYEMEIASGSIMRGFMSVPCDVYFTMEAKISRFLDCSLKLYDVPKEKRAAITAAVLQMDLHTMALGIIQKTVQQAEKGFEALTEK